MTYGTSDGAGLFCGVLRYLVELGSECPKVLVATHFHDIFQEGLLDPKKNPITFVHMEVMFTSRDGEVIAASDSKDVEMSCDQQEDEGEEEVGNVVRAKERITYLYR